MKKLTRNIAYLIVTLILFTACSTAPQVDSPNRIGTWRIDSPEHAIWIGSESQPMRVAYSLADSASSDTTYFFSNDSLQIEIVEPTDYGGNFRFVIHDQTIGSDYLQPRRWADTEVSNLGQDFRIVSGARTRLWQDKSRFNFSMKFNCGSTNDTTGDLVLAYIQSPDTAGAVRDTLFYYHINTDGLYQTVGQVACN